MENIWQKWSLPVKEIMNHVSFLANPKDLAISLVSRGLLHWIWPPSFSRKNGFNTWHRIWPSCSWDTSRNMNYSGDQCYTLSRCDEKVDTWVLQSHICMTWKWLRNWPHFLKSNEAKENWPTDTRRYPGMMKIDILKISWHNEENPES